MGASTSIPDKLSVEDATKYAGDKMDLNRFDSMKTEDGLITKDQFMNAVRQQEVSPPLPPTDEQTGRVTIFSLATCPHCKTAKALLTSYNVDYYEVSLTYYAEKRADMLALSDRLTVPQVFFNLEHIGGASDLEAMHAEGSLRGALDATYLKPPPNDPRYDRPDRPPTIDAAIAQPDEQLICIGEDCLAYSAAVEMLKAGLPVKERTYHLRTYKDCFLGSELVDFLMEK